MDVRQRFVHMYYLPVTFFWLISLRTSKLNGNHKCFSFVRWLFEFFYQKIKKKNVATTTHKKKILYCTAYACMRTTA